MTNQIEITIPGGETRVVPMPDDELLVGSGRDADVRLRGPGVELHHLRFVRSGSRVRVEPVRPGGTITVNGERLYCKDVANGDVVELGAARLRWIGSVTASAAPVVRRRREPSSRRTDRRAGGVPAWLPVTGITAVVVLGGVLVLRALGGSTWPRTPEHYVELAREQMGNGKPQLALDTLAFALQDASGHVREEALSLQDAIRRTMLETAESPKVQQARAEHGELASFHARYLTGSAERPAARDFVRQCDQWLARHGELCRRNSEGQPLLRFVEEERARNVAVAALSEPDTAADVVFAARSRLRFQWRDYRGAIGVIDRHLSGRDDAEVRAERERIVAEGFEWLQGKLRTVDMLIERGDVTNAEGDLQQIERWSMLPDWQSPVQERRARLAQRR